MQHHQYGQSEQRHRHLRSGRGSIYLVEGALDAQRRRQHEQVLVQRLPPCSFETTLPPHPGRTGKWSAGFLQRFQSCTTELLSQLTSISHRHYAKGFICLRLTRHLVDFFGCFDFCFFSAGQGSARGAPRDDAVVVVQTVSRPRHAVAQVSDWWCGRCVDQAWTSKQVCEGPVLACFTVKSRLARQRLLPLYTLIDWRECTSHRSGGHTARTPHVSDYHGQTGETHPPHTRCGRG